MCACVSLLLLQKFERRIRNFTFGLKNVEKPLSLYFLKRKKRYIYIGAVHKWCHPFGGEGVSAEKWCYSISLFSKMGDKGEGQKFQKMGDVIMDDPILTTQKAFLLQKISFPFVQNEFQNSFF